MSHVLDNTNTTASMGIDDTYNGDLGFIVDRDWIAIISMTAKRCRSI